MKTTLHPPFRLQFCGTDSNSAASEIWEFVRYEKSVWQWRRLSREGHLQFEAQKTFASFQDCVKDAEAAGFGATQQ